VSNLYKFFNSLAVPYEDIAVFRTFLPVSVSNSLANAWPWLTPHPMAYESPRQMISGLINDISSSLSPILLIKKESLNSTFLNTNLEDGFKT
jgi:hypothetical protein